MNTAAGPLKSKHRWTIGFLSGWQIYERTILVDYYGELLQGILRTAHERQANLLLACGMSPSTFPIVVRPAWPVQAPSVDFVPVGDWNTDGLIIAYPLVDEFLLRYVDQLKARKFPFVIVSGAGTHSASQIDNASGIFQAMSHLLEEHGHRRIAFIGGHANDMNGDSGERLDAYRQFVSRHGLDDDPRLIEFGEQVYEGGYQAMQAILKSGAPFTAVLTSGGKSALGVVRALKDAGLAVPGDIAVVGFDDTVQAALSHPPLTTVRFSAFELGRQAFNLLFEQIQEPENPPPAVKVSPHLVVRQSCGCEAERPPEVGELAVGARPADALDPRSLAAEMARAVLPFVLYLKENQVKDQCSRLAGAFVRAMQDNAPEFFRSELEQVLRFVASISDDAYAWSWSMDCLRDSVNRLELSPAQARFTDQLIFQARATIAESIQRQYLEYLENQRQRANQMGLLSSRLLSALDEQQVYRILAEQLPEMGIAHLALAFFRENMDGRPEFCDFQVVLGEKKEPFSISTREFPPQELYRGSEPFTLALLPLGGETQLSGYAVFEAVGLESYGAITQQIKVALRLTRLYQGALDGLKAAEEAGRLKSRFLSMVSHELQTPLHVIVGDSGRLLSDTPEAPPLKRIHASARHLEALIRDVLDLTRDEIGQLKLTREPLDLPDTLQSVFQIGEQLAVEKGLSWIIKPSPNLPLVWADSARLRQVTLNLVTNAVKFTMQGSVEVEIARHGKDVLVSVRDTGPGVPLEEQKMIFGEFYQSSRTQAQKYSGLGLGLAISKRLVEMHGGEIGVQSDGRSGSIFFFSVPILGVSDAPLPIAQGRAEQVEPARLADPKPRSILLVDDEPLLLEMHTQIIRETIPFAQVVTAQDGEQALASMRRSPPDLVMLDLMMPGMDGFSVLETMQKQETTRSIPVIILTGQALSEEDMARLRGRVEAVLNKGLIRAEEVQAQLRKALTRQDGLSGDLRLLMRKSIAYIQEHYDEPLSRQEVARYVGMSGSYFSRCFHQEAGISFQEYLNRYRIHRARILLAEGVGNVTEVAFSVGFQNVSYFCQVFRQVVGVSPRVYQKSNS